MADISMPKMGVFILGIIVLVLIISILITTGNPTIKSFKNSINKLIGIEDKEKNNPETETNKVPAHFLELVKSYKECKYSPDSNCYCKLSYSPTTPNSIIEFESNGNNLNINLHTNNLIDYNSVTNKGASLQSIPNKESVTYEEQVANQILYFKNTYFSPSISNSQFNLNEFTLAQKQYLTNNELYSTKDVNGKDVITLSGGLAIYRFDQEKSALFSFSDVNGLKKCNSYPQINEAIAELERLCLFDGLEDSKPEDGNTFYILNFNDPIKMQIFSFKDTTCFLPFDQDLIELEKSSQQRSVIARSIIDS